MPASERAIVLVSREMRASDREWTSRRTDPFRFKLSLLPLPQPISSVTFLIPSLQLQLLSFLLLTSS